MIDIHTHIIFDVDDGPRNIEESIKILKNLYLSGIKKIIATSHRRKGRFESDEKKILKNYNLLKEEILKIYPDLELYYGSEIYYDFGILNKIKENIIPSLANSNNILIEFNTNVSFKELFDAIYNIKLLGKTPIIAHLERYEKIEFSEKKIKAIIDIGAYIQVNSSSVLKTKFFDKERNNKKRCKFLLDKRFVHFVASDVHNLNNRKSYMKEAFEKVSKDYGIEYANKIFKNNAKEIIKI